MLMNIIETSSVPRRLGDLTAPNGLTLSVLASELQCFASRIAIRLAA
jgi:hypothetical protein